MWYREIAWIEPREVAWALADLPELAWLDSAMPHPQLGRYSVVAADPFGTFRVEGGHAFWNAEALAGDPLQALRTCLARYPIEPEPDRSPINPGAIGTLSYEFGWLLDRGQNGAPPASGETVRFGFYDTLIAFDHREGRCWIAASGWPASARSERRERAAVRSDALARRLRAVASGETPRVLLRWQATASRDAYVAGIERVQAYIRAGDIYQANIAQRFTAAVPPGSDTLALYDQLRTANPAPFAAYLRRGAASVLSSSPERLLRLQGRSVETRPIKGTARRVADEEEDAAIRQALLASDKDRAENVMIVDLLRNDLSRVCEPASVAVPALCALETYAGVHHLVSVVTGELRAGCDALDLVAATFPGGSITGAPKLRAMEIIAEIEGQLRGLYCGAIGRLGFDGSLDLNIPIRTVVIEEGTATMQAGGGITILSDPQGEYRETLIKARRIFDAFEPAEGPA